MTFPLIRIPDQTEKQKKSRSDLPARRPEANPRQYQLLKKNFGARRHRNCKQQSPYAGEMTADKDNEQYRCCAEVGLIALNPGRENPSLQKQNHKVDETRPDGDRQDP